MIYCLCTLGNYRRKSGRVHHPWTRARDGTSNPRHPWLLLRSFVSSPSHEESLISLLDKEKKKYFKIQSSGAAPPSAAYSQQDVKKRKLNDEKAKSGATAEARERGLIKRSRILLEPLAGGLLGRENGQDGLDTAQILAGGLVSQGYISAMMQFSSCSAPLFAFGHRPELGSSISDLWIGEYSSFDTSTYFFHIKSTTSLCLVSEAGSRSSSSKITSPQYMMINFLLYESTRTSMHAQPVMAVWKYVTTLASLQSTTPSGGLSVLVTLEHRHPSAQMRQVGV
jgi:hypothetical protein